MKKIQYGKQHITDEDIEAVVKVLRSDFLTTGPQVKKFEEAFAKYIGSKYAVAVANGTAALHLSAMALDVKSGDKVITTPLTFAASANCVRFCGGEVVFADINPETYLLDFENVKYLLESSQKGTYKGIIPVDFAGYPVNLEKFKELADEYNVWILEDACHAPGGFFVDSNGNKQFCGNGKFSDVSVFSFHPVKHITTGEGGIITTNDEQKYKRLLSLRSHGLTKDVSSMKENHGGWYYEMLELGYNYRLTDFQAALGLSQLKKAGKRLRKRHEIVEKYNNAFAKTNIVLPKLVKSVYHAYHLYVIQTERRKEMYDYLQQQNIFSQVHYIPVHFLPYYKNLGWEKGDFPKTEKYYEHCLSLPLYPSLSEEEQNYVIEKVIEFVSKHKK